MASAEAHDVDDLRTIPVDMGGNGAPISLDAVAEVVERAEDRLYRVQGPVGKTVLMTVARLEGESTLAVTAAAIAAMAALKPTLPPGIRIEPVYDQSGLMREALASVRGAVLLGIVSCLIVLGAFLRNARSVAGLAAPVKWS